jgi:hypothetical protein
VRRPSAERDLSTTCPPPTPANGERETARALDIHPHLQRDEWLVGRGYLSAESISLVLQGEEQISLNKEDKEVGELQAA